MASLVTTSPVNTRIEELGRIIMAYSDVTEKLQKSHAQLQQTVQSLRNDLADKNRQLERRNRLAALGEMAAGMAHEIRNPLGGIQLYASLLAKDVSALPESLKLVNKISTGVKRLEGLVSQVLRFSSEITPTMAEADVAEIIEQSMDLAAPKFQTLGVRCDANGPRPMPARLDPLLFGQAVLNLLLNAAEAIGDGGTITIRWSTPDDGRQLRLTICDTGPGIPPAVLDRIFNPFFTTKETGTGLGLAIVHRIIEAHDGTISATNPPEGGAMFEIRM